jgi:UDP-2-acetamido-2-deoxy-ribo-hexuluronate aminotransferase
LSDKHQGLGKTIPMVDLQGQYLRLKGEIDTAVLDVMASGHFIQGKQVFDFESELAAYTGSPFVVSCANGTDALQLACMALPLQRGDMVMVPAFTYVATAEVLHLLGLQPVFCDVDPLHFMLTPEALEKAWQPGCKALMVVHLFGQCPDMEAILEWASFRGVWVIEDNAQSIGSIYSGKDFSRQAGTMGSIGTTSFFPSKNLGAYGDAGAIFTADESLAHQIRMMANHGQTKRYYHDIIGMNSRLDAIQAAILRVKLRHLDDFISSRQEAAALYDYRLGNVDGIHIPYRNPHSTHVFHQYTLRLDLNINRQHVQDALLQNGISSAVYYPLPVYDQKAYRNAAVKSEAFPVTGLLCKTVLSLPMHTELSTEEIDYICNTLITAIHG